MQDIPMYMHPTYYYIYISIYKILPRAIYNNDDKKIINISYKKI